MYANHLEHPYLSIVYNDIEQQDRGLLNLMTKHHLLLMMTIRKILCHCLSYINRKKKELFISLLL
jgi:hypothetical protein